MWLLRRMKILKLDPHLIFEYYSNEIRPLCEQVVAAWHPAITKNQQNLIEKVQKVALKIILANDYHSYENACNQFHIQTLKGRRDKLCLNYALRLYKSPRCEEYFSLVKTGSQTRRQKLVVEATTRTKRAYNSPINYLSRLINANAAKLV